MKKYEIVKSKSIVYNGRTLYRIRALKDFWTAPIEMIHKGDLGGYVESENNLSQEGYCWIRNNAKVYDNAKVLDDAVIYKHAEIFGYAVIRKNAQVDDYAQICGAAEVFHNAKIYGNAVVTGKAQIYNNAQIHGFAVVCGKAKIRNYAQIYDSACVSDEAEVCGSSLVCNVAEIGKNKKIKNGKYIFKSLNVDETLSEIEPICYKISFAVRVIELKLPIEQGYIESLVSQFAEYNKLADSFYGRTYLSPKEKEILAMLSQCKEDVKILKKVVLKMKVKKGEKIKYEF